MIPFNFLKRFHLFPGIRILYTSAPIVRSPYDTVQKLDRSTLHCCFKFFLTSLTSILTYDCNYSKLSSRFWITVMKLNQKTLEETDQWFSMENTKCSDYYWSLDDGTDVITAVTLFYQVNLILLLHVVILHFLLCWYFNSLMWTLIWMMYAGSAIW